MFLPHTDSSLAALGIKVRKAQRCQTGSVSPRSSYLLVMWEGKSIFFGSQFFFLPFLKRFCLVLGGRCHSVNQQSPKGLQDSKRMEKI